MVEAAAPAAEAVAPAAEAVAPAAEAVAPAAEAAAVGKEEEEDRAIGRSGGWGRIYWKRLESFQYHLESET